MTQNLLLKIYTSLVAVIAVVAIALTLNAQQIAGQWRVQAQSSTQIAALLASQHGPTKAVTTQGSAAQPVSAVATLPTTHTS
jgi:hypothetical protein